MTHINVRSFYNCFFVLLQSILAYVAGILPAPVISPPPTPPVRTMEEIGNDDKTTRRGEYEFFAYKLIGFVNKKSQY